MWQETLGEVKFCWDFSLRQSLRPTAFASTKNSVLTFCLLDQTLVLDLVSAKLDWAGGDYVTGETLFCETGPGQPLHCGPGGL